MFGDDDRFKEAAAVAAVLFREPAAEEAEVGHLFDQFGAEGVVGFVFFKGRDDLFLGKVPRHLLHHFLFVGQSEIHRGLLLC